MKLLSFILFFSALSSYTQDTINQLDSLGKKSGYWEITASMRKLPDFNDTAIVEKGFYKQNRKVGLWVKYYPNGNKKSEIEYIYGRARGKFTTYYSSGCIEADGDFSDINHKKQVRYQNDCKGPSSLKGTLVVANVDRVKKWTSSGERIEEYKINDTVFYRNEKGDILKTVVLRISNETPKVELPLFNLSINGYHKIYNNNGDLVLDGEFKEGKLFNGKHYIYDENGLLERIGVYKEGRYAGNGIIGNEYLKKEKKGYKH